MSQVTKRSGSVCSFNVQEILQNLQNLSFDLNMEYIDVNHVANKVAETVYPLVTTEEIEVYSAMLAASMSYIHPDYALLAGRIMVHNLHKKIAPSFVECAQRLFSFQLINQKLYDFIVENGKVIDASLEHRADYEYKYFGFKTLENGYLIKIDGKTAERIQHMYMRVALTIHLGDIESAIQSYRCMAKKLFTHASPTLFSAGTFHQQLSSCFLVDIAADSVEGIYNTLTKCALISKYGGGIGLNVHKIRANGSYIKSTNGNANGLEPMLRVYNNMVRHVNQGGKRKGAMAVYLEPWHADILDFLNLKKIMGTEEKKARDLLYALWVPDLFMKRVEQNGVWSLMCPSECPNLDSSFGQNFETLYENYEKRGQYKYQLSARKLFRYIIETQVETGTPYMMYKDHVNAKSNQQNLGTIKSSNLCAEIVQYCDYDETAVCNLASICVNQFVNLETGTFDFDKLKSVTQIVVRNLNKIIDINLYPTECSRKCNLKHRPVGVGIQGLADAFILMKFPYESNQAKQLNKQIAETIYYGALEASNDLARVEGIYESFESSPASKGILQFDMWNNVKPTSLWDWDELKRKITTHGLRNSLLVAYMPTATTAQIFGNNESFEPFTSNIYVRRVLAGDFQIINNHLVKDLVQLGLYDKSMRNEIIANNGSVQSIARIPKHIRDLYKTAWEMKNKTMLDMAADRGAFIDQSQSLNIFVAQPNYQTMCSIHNYGHKIGLKTGMYYLRTKPATNAIQFTVENSGATCSKSRENDCVACHS
ncbi:Ribonucleotide reductase 1 [Perigonia lusca single nucleopolyhedrovirus]|uniref:Ribonucleoside-diphosphate reductase n=1 Tax=Perigonia lusca single nucleopolyhedrovirus TaxID=1675865 RepID=A0A0M3WP18_9ABAC|nr:Ribonucleotide reductase 1 [Perigonia lusca single nucleopolyhedrovirus]AKN80691.1 Ribonucleotide reductase 1 [Perigonia lusca single nucleopolyhedrovirus]